MSLLNMILGNATEIPVEELQKEFADILLTGETIESAYKVIRDKWVFTSLRLIILNVQGVTGAKREYHSLPYRAIAHFSIETAGTLDDDCELRIYLQGINEPFMAEFGRRTNIKGIQRALASHVLQP